MAKTFAHTWAEFFHFIPFHRYQFFTLICHQLWKKKENFFFVQTKLLHYTHTHVVKKNEGPENSTIWNRKKKEKRKKREIFALNSSQIQLFNFFLFNSKSTHYPLSTVCCCFFSAKILDFFFVADITFIKFNVC